MLDLDLSSVSESGLPPAGEYQLCIDDAVVKDTKSGTGQYINVRWKFLDGPSEGATFFTMFNIKNDNPTAVRIGLGELKRLLKAAGRDTSKLAAAGDLCGVVVRAIIAIKEDDFGERVVIKKFITSAEPTPSF